MPLTIENFRRFDAAKLNVIFDIWYYSLLSLRFAAIESKPPLIVKKIDINDSAEVVKVVSSWREIARLKAERAKASNEVLQFKVCSTLSREIGNEITDPNSSYDIYVCKDKKGNYQGMMAIAVEIKQIYILYLVTNPINIRSSVNRPLSNLRFC